MPNCFQLFRKNDPKNAVPLNTIDAELCKLLGKEVHPTLYVNGWFDYIGFKLACGKTFEQIRADILADIAKNDPHYADSDRAQLICLDYLAENYTPSAWAEIGRRK